MKKVVLAVLSVVFAAANVFAAGQINTKFEVGLINALYGTAKLGYDYSYSSNGQSILSGSQIENIDTGSPTGFAFYGEYLYPIIQKLKVGGGLGYSYQGNIPVRFGTTDLKDSNKEAVTSNANLFPIYLTVQFHPLSTVEGFFVKGNVGLTVLTSFVFSSPEVYRTASKTLYGNMYYGLSTGYEFASGFICELAFSAINYRVEYKDTYYYIDENDDSNSIEESIDATWKFSYRRVGLTLGYKF